jgi:hypothetical protein
VTPEPWDPMAAGNGGRGPLRASDADREQAIDILKVAFVQGRLTQDEFGLRAGQALVSRTYAELTGLTTDLLAGPTEPARPGPRPARPVPKSARTRAKSPVSVKVVVWGACAAIALPALGAAFLTFYGGFIVLFLFAFVGLAVTAGP